MEKIPRLTVFPLLSLGSALILKAFILYKIMRLVKLSKFGLHMMLPKIGGSFIFV